MIEESIAQKISKGALREQTENRKNAHLADRSEPLAIEKQFACEPVYQYIVSIEDKPITKQRFLNFDSDIKFTRGMYSIQYIPLRAYKRNPKFPYLIGQDLVRLRITVSGPRHWGCLCQRIPELGWIQRNSTFRDELFAIAKKHPGLVLRFGIDYAKYCAKIEERAEREGLDIDHKPLFTYLWNDDMKKEIGSVDITGWQKTKADYKDALKEAENSLTVQKEIKGE